MCVYMCASYVCVGADVCRGGHIFAYACVHMHIGAYMGVNMSIGEHIRVYVCVYTCVGHVCA